MLKKLEIEIGNTGHITNSYILYNESKNCVLIDAPDKADYIIQNIESLGLRLEAILLTHAHADHTLALNDLLKRYDVKAFISSNEQDMILGKITDYSDVFNENVQMHDENRIIFLENEEKVPKIDMDITIYNTPGHTSGSSCYYYNKENILFTGDTLFSSTIGRWDLETGSLDDSITSALKIYNAFNSLNTVIYPGHGESGMTVKDTYMKVSRVIFNNSGVDITMLK